MAPDCFLAGADSLSCCKRVNPCSLVHKELEQHVEIAMAEGRELPAVAGSSISSLLWAMVSMVSTRSSDSPV